MENFDIQTLTLLTTIVSLTATLLSISQSLQKNGFISSIRGITLCILPVLLIQQILQLTYKTKFVLSFLFLAISVLLLIIEIINNRKKTLQFLEISKKDKTPYILVIIVTSFFTLQNYIIGWFLKNHNTEIDSFIKLLSKEKISMNMYIFLSENLKCTLFLLSDTITLILLAVSLGYALKYFYENRQDEFGTGSDSDFNMHKHFKLNAYAFLFAIGAIKYLITYMISLF